jgi:hypothetical protein
LFLSGAREAVAFNEYVSERDASNPNDLIKHMPVEQLVLTPHNTGHVQR